MFTKLIIRKSSVERVCSSNMELKEGQIFVFPEEIAKELIQKGIAKETTEGKALNEFVLKNKALNPTYEDNMPKLNSTETFEKEKTEVVVKRKRGRPKKS